MHVPAEPGSERKKKTVAVPSQARVGSPKAIACFDRIRKLELAARLPALFSRKKVAIKTPLPSVDVSVTPPTLPAFRFPLFAVCNLLAGSSSTDPLSKHTMAASKDGSLALPRILCLHGGGVNAEVFELQCRNLVTRLKPYFRLCFVDAPFICEPHPQIVRVYGDYGPFRRWMRWLPEHAEIDDATTVSQIEYQLRLTMEEDDEKGGTGPWVGLLGFSQGAKISASLLFTQQKLGETIGKDAAWTKFRFAVLLAGRAPVVSLDSRVVPVPAGVAAASELSISFQNWPDPRDTDQRIRLPTIHVHGLKDPGLEHHRKLLHLYCEEGTATLVEWDGEHRVPIKAQDVEAVAKEMIALGKKLDLIS